MNAFTFKNSKIKILSAKDETILERMYKEWCNMAYNRGASIIDVQYNPIGEKPSLMIIYFSEYMLD